MLRRDTRLKEREPEVFVKEMVTRTRIRESTEPIKLVEAYSDPNKIGKESIDSSLDQIEIEIDLGLACDCGEFRCSTFSRSR